jgi:membrane protease subunit HflC
VRAQVRGAVGQNTLTDVLTDKRLEILARIRTGTHESFASSGVDIHDVRINRTELPRGIEANVHARMETDRQRLARKYRAEGEEKARKIRAEAEREAQVTVAEERGTAEVTRGEGDAQAAGIYAQAYNVDPAFYAFVRSLEAYRKTIGRETTLVLSPDSEFFEFFDHGLELAPPRPPVSAAPE